MIIEKRRLHATWECRGVFHTRLLGHVHQKYDRLVQFETRPGERIAISSNTVARNRPLQHTASCLHRESCMHEDEGRAIPKGTFNNKSVTGCTQTEFANRSTRSTRTGCNDNLWVTQRIKEFRGDLEQHRGLQNSWHTPFYSRTAGYKSQRQGRKVDWEVREYSEQRILPSRLHADEGDQRVQREIKGSHRRHEQHWNIRTLRNIFKTAMSWLQFVLGDRHWLLYLWKMIKIIAGRQEQQGRLVKTWPGRKTSAVSDMDLLNDNECITRLKKCCKKLVKKNMEDTHPFLRDGITTTNTESLCH